MLSSNLLKKKKWIWAFRSSIPSTKTDRLDGKLILQKETVTDFFLNLKSQNIDTYMTVLLLNDCFFVR